MDRSFCIWSICAIGNLVAKPLFPIRYSIVFFLVQSFCFLKTWQTEELGRPNFLSTLLKAIEYGYKRYEPE
jgi:hypothetical protein